MNVIEIKQLSKYYGKARGIVEVSFNVQEGEIFGFIGPNGAGKSTTIRILLALIYPSSGQARIFGKDCIKHGTEIRNHIGYLPAEVYYYDHMRVIDLLKYSASFYKNVDKNRIRKLAEIMDLDLNRKIDDLSYGNKKKVGIVQGLIHQPRLIILDEPTGGLDPLIQQQFFNLIREENQNGATVLFSSHVLSEVQKLCSQVAIIKEGQIIGVEDIKALQNNNYKKFKIQLAETVSSDYFNIDGVADLTVDENSHTFLFRGDINQMIARIHDHRITNLIVEEPALEEVFMHYYEREA
ncbi:abc transporter, atp-binding protein [hydrocarbon metagenome]|uniref:Abc transporter, atp-binding protein n=1 Tax=hydrocarbon metagenome TaxID=938273 RepID=A0A0W8E928_9ZZZZ